MAEDHGPFAAPDANRGLNRRSLIRNAVILGGTAWTAPVVLDSIASPAGALSVNGCFAMWSRLTLAGTWSAWASDFATLPDPLECLPPEPSPDCFPILDATADILAATGLPSPAPANNSAVPVTVNAPSGCRIFGSGVWIRSTTGNGQPDVCSAANGNLAGTRVDIDIPILTKDSVTFTPHGTVGGANNGYWDNEGGLRSFIFIVLTCP